MLVSENIDIKRGPLRRAPGPHGHRARRGDQSQGSRPRPQLASLNTCTGFGAAGIQRHMRGYHNAAPLLITAPHLRGLEPLPSSVVQLDRPRVAECFIAIGKPG